MSYTATCARIETISKHPNADRLQLATVCGMQVIVGLEARVGDLGLYFPPGGILSTEFAVSHKLAKSVGGYLPDHKPRVEAMKLRGIPSYGVFVPVTDATHMVGAWQEGDTVGEPICKKYLPPSQQGPRMSTGKQASKRAMIGLPRHYDTPQIWNVIRMIPVGAHVFVTEKIHGTSGRSGLMRRPKPKNLWEWMKSWFQSEFVYVCGSRNVEFYVGSEAGARKSAHETLRLYVQPGEVWYYEIFGYDGDKKIQPDLEDPETKQKVSYTYGRFPGDYLLHVYRIQSSSGREMTPDEVWERAKYVNIMTEYPYAFVHESPSKTMQVLSARAALPSRYDDKTVREGIVAVFTDLQEQEVISVAKLKSFKFCQMEGIAYGGDKYIDTEEAA